MRFIVFILLFVFNANAEEIRIGVMPSLTGTFAELGEDCRRGAEVAAKALAPDNKIGGKELKLIYGDSQADPKVSVSEFKKLTEQDKVLAIVTMRSRICLPLNPISKQKHVPLICGSGHPNFHSGSDYAHQSWSLTETEGGILADHVISKGIKDIAIITGEDEWLLSLSTKFTERYEAQGAKVAVSETMLTTDYDANSLLTKIRSKNPSALFINLTLAQNPIVIKRARELGFTIPIFTNFWAGDESSIKSAGAAIEGISYPEAELDYPKFIAALNTFPKPKKPSGATISCFASTAAALLAAKNNELKTSEDMQKALLELKMIEALDVSIPVNNRRFMFPMVIKQVRQGKVLKLN